MSPDRIRWANSGMAHTLTTAIIPWLTKTKVARAVAVPAPTRAGGTVSAVTIARSTRFSARHALM
jgi:hypothetical protein